MAGRTPCYQARSTFRGGDEGETDLMDDEVVPVLEKTSTGWWMVHSRAGVGWVPSHFLRLPPNTSGTTSTVAELPCTVHEETGMRKYAPRLPANKESVKLKGHIAFRYLQFAHGNTDTVVSAETKRDELSTTKPSSLQELFNAPAATASDTVTVSHTGDTVKPATHRAEPPIRVKKSAGNTAKTTSAENPKLTPTSRPSSPPSSVRPSSGSRPSGSHVTNSRQVSGGVVSMAKQPPAIVPRKQHQQHQHQHQHHTANKQGADTNTAEPQTLQSVSDLKALFNRV